MTLAPLAQILDERRAAHAAVGAFTAYTGETAVAVVRAAEELAVPAVILVSEAAFQGRDGRLLLPQLLAIAAASSQPICVELDHVREPGLIRQALELGVGAVMADGSRLAYAENVAFVQQVRQLANAHGAHVEAELGRVEGSEDIAELTDTGTVTDPGLARAFARATGADCLAISIGNVHGRYRHTPRLDFDRLRQIRAATDVPLSLHGASGLPPSDLRRAVALGVSKINVNTEIRERLVLELGRTLPAVSRTANLLQLSSALIDAAAEVVADKLVLLSHEDGMR